MEGGVKEMVNPMLVGGLLCCLFFIYYLYVFLVKPTKAVWRLRRQGIKGPSPTILLGSILQIKRIKQLQFQKQGDYNKLGVIDHDWPSRVFPHLQQWILEFGPTFVYSMGNIHFFFTIDVDIVREISSFTSLNLGRPSYLSKHHGALLGQSLIATDGSVWMHQKKIIAPEFYLDRVKSMVGLMLDSMRSMLQIWESKVESQGGILEMDIEKDMRRLSADIISRACFGSNYAQGEEIFLKLKMLQNLLSKSHIGFPGSRYWPTKTNREIWKLEEQINSSILKIVKRRSVEAYQEKDLLQMILEGAKSYSQQKGVPLTLSFDKFVVDNCKAIYFAGQDTTASTASWCLMLLATNQDWQARVRAEVLKVCNDGIPDADTLSKMKTLTMVIQETLRLYPAGGFVVRCALEDVKIKDIIIPKGMNIQLPIQILQQNPDIWGSDAHQFNPERFANGIRGATASPQAYIPFGVGSRICVGQHFAMLELKLILSQILLKFEFSLSEMYCHSPVFKLTLEAEKGISLQIRKTLLS